MTIPPSKADMKRGALGPSPVRVNTLWNKQRARAAGQYSADVSARNRETGKFVRVTGDFGGEIVDGHGRPWQASRALAGRWVRAGDAAVWVERLAWENGVLRVEA